MIGIVGAGQVGSTLAFELFRRNLDDIALVDVVSGLAEGKALDIAQCGSLLGINREVVGSEDLTVLKEADIVVITAGYPRQPGMSRLDLAISNAQILKNILSGLASLKISPILVIVTNPLDLMVRLALKILSFSRERVMGMGGLLDSARFRYYLAKKLGLSLTDIQGMVVGEHGDRMIPLFSTVGITFTNSELKKEIVENTKNGGATIVKLLGKGSAYFAPAVSTALMVESILKNKGELFSVAYLAKGEFGLEDVVLSLPAFLNRDGLKPAELSLSWEELETLRKAAAEIKNFQDDFLRNF